MPVPYSYAKLEERFAIVRAWGKAAFPDINRCAVCMSYTVNVRPDKAAGDATLSTQPDAANKARIAGGIHTEMDTSDPDHFFVRASELLPAMQKKYGPPEVDGPANLVWPRIVKNQGVLYLEDLYQTAGDKKKEAVVASIGGPIAGVLVRKMLKDSRTYYSGDHWDLFDGKQMVIEEQGIAGTQYTVRMCFWKCS